VDIDARTNDDPEKLRGEIARYPTDLRLRFGLGAALCMRRDYSGAIPELLAGMCSPHDRLKSMKLLIEAYEGTGNYELAASTREQLSRESGEDSSSGSAPVPAPTRPITPPDLSRAEEPPHEDDTA
jgi:hypothetical protein